MNIDDILEIIEQQKRSDSLMDMGSMYFENNKDLIAAGDFEAAMKLGCFDKEFTYYGTAYLDHEGRICYRISAQSNRLYQFIAHSTIDSLYPTPILRNMVRRPAPSGHEEKIKLAVKKDTARQLQALYSPIYFQALKTLSNIAPNNTAYPLLKELQERWILCYDDALLQLFEGLLQTALDSKVLTLQSWNEFFSWLNDMRHQMENDIVPKGQYKKHLSGFAYITSSGDIRYFYDAKPEVVLQKKAEMDLSCTFSTSIYHHHYHLREMGEFPQIHKTFAEELKQFFSPDYVALFQQIKAFPSAIPQNLFAQQCALVKQNCSQKAYQSFLSYKYRWNLAVNC